MVSDSGLVVNVTVLDFVTVTFVKLVVVVVE